MKKYIKQKKVVISDVVKSVRCDRCGKKCKKEISFRSTNDIYTTLHVYDYFQDDFNGGYVDFCDLCWDCVQWIREQLTFKNREEETE